MTKLLAFLLALAIFTPPMFLLALLAHVRRNERLTIEISRTITRATTSDRHYG